jgi:hypothetical protein
MPKILVSAGLVACLDPSGVYQSWWWPAYSAAILLVAVYVLAAEANSRELTDAVAVVWPEAIAAVLLAFAFGTGSVVGARSG